MKKIPPWADTIKQEWEAVVLAIGLLLLLLVAIRWLLVLFGQADLGLPFAGPGGDPLPPSRVNYNTAYALLERPAAGEPAPSAFVGDLEFQPPAKPKPPTPEPPPDPPKPKPPRPRPDPPPVAETPPPTPTPALPTAPEPEIFVYQGYRTDARGQRLAIMHNQTTGESYAIAEGRQFFGLMVTKFSSHQITFMAPNGQTRTLPAGEELPYTPPPK